MRSKVSILLGKYAQPTIPQGERGKYHNCTNYEVVGSIMPRADEHPIQGRESYTVAQC